MVKQLCALVVIVCALAGCGTVASWVAPTPNPKPAANLAHVQRLVAKDTDPADLPANAAALSVAQEIAAEADKSGDLGGTISAYGAAAAGTGTPTGILIGSILGTIGLGFTTLKTAMRMRGKSKDKPADRAAPAPLP